MSGTSLGNLYVTLGGEDAGFLALTQKAEAAVERMEAPVAALGAAARATQAPIASLGAALGATQAPAAAAATALQDMGNAAAVSAEKVVREAAGVWALEPPLDAVAEAAPKAAEGTAALGKNAEKTAGSAKKAAGETSSLADTLQELATLYIADKAVDFLADSIESFLSAERSARKLEQALQQTHGEMGSFSTVLEGYADQMERATGVDGDFIQSIEQLLLQMRIAPEDITRVTKAALDLSAATGGDAKQAAVLLAKASAENVAELKRWGIEVDEAKVQTEGFTAVLSEVERVYGGTVEQMSEAERAIAANKAAWGDLKEAIGGAMTRMLEATHIGSGTATYLDALTEFISRKKEYENAAVSQRNEQIAHMMRVEGELEERLKRVEQDFNNLAGTADEGSESWQKQKEEVEDLTFQLEEATRQRKEFQGISTGGPVPVMKFEDEDALDVESDYFKRQTDAAKAATEAYERFSRAAEKASDYAGAQSSLEARRSGEADDQSFKAAMEIQASELDANTFIESMNAEMAKADAALGAATISDDARSAADSWSRSMAEVKAYAEENARAAAQAAAASDAAWSAIGSKAISSMGKLGSVASDAMAAMAGGPFAVLASVLLDLAVGSEQFKPILQAAEGIFITLANAVGALLVPLKPVIGALGVVATALISGLSPVLTEVGEVFQALAPSLMVLGATVAALAPIFEVLVKPFLEIQKVIATALFPVLKYVAIISLTVLKALGTAWNGVVGAIQWVLHQIGKLPVVGDAADKLAKSLDGMRLNTDAMGRQIKSISEMTFDSAMEDATNAADAFGQTAADAAKSADKASEAMDNVPAAWRKNLRIFEAQTPQGPPAPPAPPVPTSSVHNGGMPERPPRAGQETNPSSPSSPNLGGPFGDQIGKTVQVVMNISGYDLKDAVENAGNILRNNIRLFGASSTGLSTSTSMAKPYGVT